MGERYSATRAVSVMHHLANSSRRSYESGVTAFVVFSNTNQLPLDLFTSPFTLPTVITTVFVCFACALREGITGKSVKASTISQYISHVINYIKENHANFQLITSIRSDQLRLVLVGMQRDDNLRAPHRLTRRIPISAAFVRACFVWIRANILDPFEQSRLLAAISLLYGACLRRGELIHDPKSLADHALHPNHCVFMWEGDPQLYPFSSLSFPPGSPSSMSLFHDSTKNAANGTQPRGICANPDRNADFCFVTSVYHHIRTYGCPSSGNAVFPGLTIDPIIRVLRAVAVLEQLDPDRCRPHGFRSGSLSQLNSGLIVEEPSDELLQAHAQWTSDGGHRPYNQPGLAHASRVKWAIYDVLFMSFEFLRYYYMTQ